MRRPLIILSILLISCLVNANNHKGETLFEWGKYPDYVWKGFGDKETHPTYQGDVENGVPNGLGIMIYPNGDKYIGEWEDGKKHGEGTETYSGGEFFVGKWFENIRWNGKYYNNTTNTVSNIENGKLQERSNPIE